ncbi:MAG TPA: beta-galactosidase [Planctomycetota bacterium]|nr:beta-galactosidase [Planctomycetota bacterium]
MRRIRVARDRWNFELEGSGTPIVPLGGNILGTVHPSSGTIFRAFDRDDCDRRLGLMAQLGLNCLRQAIGVNEVFDPARGLKPEGMRSWNAFMALARKHGIYVMPVGGYVGGNDWFDAARLADHGRALDESCAFWEAFAAEQAGDPAVWAWDLRNELLYWDSPTPGSDAGDHDIIAARLIDRWPGWLERKYGDVATMNRHYAGTYGAFAAVPGSVRFVEAPYDARLHDFRCYLNDRGYDWCRRQCEVLRRVAPDHLICSGNNTWLSPDQDLFLANGFHNRAVHDLFDFITHHPYPACQAKAGGRGDPLDHLRDDGVPLRYWINACIGMSRLDHYGKPVVIQEWGWYGGGESRFLGPLPHRSEDEHAAYARRFTDALIPHAVGFLNWPTFDMSEAEDISNHGGIFSADGRPKALAGVYADLAVRLGGRRQLRAPATTTITASLLGLYTSRSVQDRLWDEVHAALEAGDTPDFRFI